MNSGDPSCHAGWSAPFHRKYEIHAQSRMGKGTFGEVWRGFVRASRSSCCVKCIVRQGYDGQEEDVRREVHLSQMCHHSNVVAVWDAYACPDIRNVKEKEPVAYIAMERCQHDLRRQMAIWDQQALLSQHLCLTTYPTHTLTHAPLQVFLFQYLCVATLHTYAPPLTAEHVVRDFFPN